MTESSDNSHKRVAKRDDYLNWNDYFMAIACLSAKRTHDARNEAGACIVNQNKIIAIGYNGLPNGYQTNKANLSICDEPFSCVHAELNAILNCSLTDQSGSIMYLSRFPCHDCAKAIIQSGIRMIYYECEIIDPDDVSTQAAESMFKMVGVECKLLPLAVDLSVYTSQVVEQSKSPAIRLNHDEFFMSVAILAAQRSKDPSTQVGACIVNEQNKIVATGYNGMPNGIHDDLVPWTKEGAYLDTKYAYVVHAELNTILNSILTDQRSCRMYVSLFPCNECAKAIIQSGIKLIVYHSDKHCDKESTKAAKIMFQLAGIKYEQYTKGYTYSRREFVCPKTNLSVDCKLVQQPTFVLVSSDGNSMEQQT